MQYSVDLIKTTLKLKNFVISKLEMSKQYNFNKKQSFTVLSNYCHFNLNLVINHFVMKCIVMSKFIKKFMSLFLKCIFILIGYYSYSMNIF